MLPSEERLRVATCRKKKVSQTMDQDKIPVAIQLQPGTGFLIAFKAAKYLFDRSPGLQIPTFRY